MRQIVVLASLLLVTAAAAQASLQVDTAAWDQTVADARREGAVSVLVTTVGTGIQEALSEGFQQRYPGIRPNIELVPAPQAIPKVLTEQAAGQFLYDLVISGTSPILPVFRPASAVVPVHPYLVGPAASDATSWRGGRYSFGDDAEEIALVFNVYVKQLFAYNPELVDPEWFTSWRDLLDPWWKGKLAMVWPLQVGSAQSIAEYWYLTEGLGPEFIRQLIQDQEMVFTREDRQALDWVARGVYPVVIGIGDDDIIEFANLGLPVRPMHGEQLWEQPYVTAGPNALAVLQNPPHPNALKVYLDWFLGREGQLAWSQTRGFASLRQDVATNHVYASLIPKPYILYIEQYKEQYLAKRQEVTEFLRTVVPS